MNMGGLRRSATSKMESGEAIWVAKTSATDNFDYDPPNEEIESASAKLGYTTVPILTSDKHTVKQFARMVSSVSESDINQGADYTDSGSPYPHLQPNARNLGCDGPRHLSEPPLPVTMEDLENNDSRFEPVDDPQSLPRLDSKPLMLRRKILIPVALFYLCVIVLLATLRFKTTLYFKEPKKFEFYALSEAAVAVLPSLIGTVSTLMFDFIIKDYARMVPYMIMAESTSTTTTEQCAPARRTLLAKNFPFQHIATAIRKRHKMLAVILPINIWLNSFVIPFKSCLIQRRWFPDDLPNGRIYISPFPAAYLIINYCILLFIVLTLMVELWDKRTGLKWDPTSLADLMVLLQGSDILEDFAGLEYHTAFPHEEFGIGLSQFRDLQAERYRLGYWRLEGTNRYWHGIRRWPTGDDMAVLTDSKWSLDKAMFKEKQPYSACTRIMDVGSHSLRPVFDTISSKTEQVIRSHNRTPRGTPDLDDRGSEASQWWTTQHKEVLRKPKRWLRILYAWISDPLSAMVFLFAALLIAVGGWVISLPLLKRGFDIRAAQAELPNFLVKVVPVFLSTVIIESYWQQLDAWYRHLRPFMDLQQPAPAIDTLFLDYSCDLPIVVTYKALSANHWRLALASTMPIVHRIFQVLVGTLFTVNSNPAKTVYHVSIFAPTVVLLICFSSVYLLTILLLWRGKNYHLPVQPLRIADPIVLFYDSTLILKDAFLPKDLHEERWHIQYRLCLEERRYAFGTYPGRTGAPHIGIDDAYEGIENGILRVQPLTGASSSDWQWTRDVRAWFGKKLRLKRRATFYERDAYPSNKARVQPNGIKRTKTILRNQNRTSRLGQAKLTATTGEDESAPLQQEDETTLREHVSHE